jgi:anti-sigma factor RsiW
MRILAAIVLVLVSLTSVGCAVRLQPAQQGEWSNFQSTGHKVSKDAAAPAEQPAGER